MLCRTYHCAPLELDAQPLDVVLAHIAVLQAEAEHQKLEAKRATIRRRRR
jgi:hypothetical protein